MNRLKTALLFVVALSGIAFSEQIAISTFKGLNNDENSTIIGPEFAQDLLNVEVSNGGKSILKRSGFGLYKNIDVGAVHGGHHFFDSTGNDVQVWGSSDNLKGIVADGTPTTLVSSATLNSTWDCADVQGNAYCVDSNRDALIRTNGATMTWYTSPVGTMVEATPERLVVAGVSGSASSLYVSESNNFINFTVGNLNSSPFVEPIAAPGSKLTHIRWGCGKLLWWKDQSFGYTNFEDQFTLENKIISDTIGSFDNTSAIDPGGNVWFRGQDGHIYKYDCAGLTKESIEITPNIQASGRRTSNSFTQTSSADWALGSSSPTAPANPLNYAISPGDIYPGSFTVTENGSSGWSSGSNSNTTLGVSSISLTLNNSGNVDNNSFEDAGVTTLVPSSWTISSVGPVVQRTNAASWGSECPSGTTSPKDGSRLLTSNCGTTGCGAYWEILDLDNVMLSSWTLNNSVAHCDWTSATLGGLSNRGKRVRLKMTASDASGTSTASGVNSFVLGGNITIWYMNATPTQGQIYWDFLQLGSSTITSGQFTSQALDTGLPYSFVMTSATWSSNTSTPSIVLQGATSASGPFIDINSSTGTNVQTSKRYLRYISSFTVGGADNALTALTGINILTRSSGTFFSQVKNAPNITAWSTFNPTYTDNGDDINFYVRSSTGVFQNGVLTSTPAWISQTPNSLVSATTGTYFQVIASFTVTAATNTPSFLSDFTVNWFEGNATDQAYMEFFDNSIWASVAYGTGVSSNTHIFRNDLINEGWTVYDIGTGGMLIQNNRLYFGDTSVNGNVFIYGSGTSDNGSAINSYWRSKSFTGPDPFLENSLTQIDTFLKKDANQVIYSSYTLNTSTSPTSYAINTSSTTQSVIQNRKLLPNGKNAYTFDIKYGDNSTTSAWEIFGYRIGFNQLPWRPSQ